jgi:hypothetical protein
MNWPYPSENQDPWYSPFEDMVSAMDASSHASREDRNILMGGGGTVSFSSTTGALAWGEDFEIYSTEVGFLFTIAATSVVLTDGQVLYVDLVRSPTAGTVLVPVIASQVPRSDSAYIIALRRADEVYFRFGSKISNGESFNIFQGGGGGSTGADTYERSATFALPDLTSTDQEATLGRISYGGSVLAVSLELTEAVVSGTIVVTIRRDGVDTLVATLDAGDPTSVQTTAVVNTWPVSSNSAMTVHVDPTSYDNLSGSDGGLTVNVTFSTGLVLGPTEIVDASTTLKGVTKLSTAPATSSNPIAVGDNDPRMSDKRVASAFGTTGASVNMDSAAPPVIGQVFTATGPTAGSWQNPSGGLGFVVKRFRWILDLGADTLSETIVIPGTAMPDADYVVIATQSSQAGGSAIVGFQTDTHTTTDFVVNMTGMLVAGDSVDFIVMERNPSDDFTTGGGP